MIRKILTLALIVCIAWTTTGCDSKPKTDMPDLSSALNETPSIPDDWAQISLSKVESGDILKITLTGKKQKFKDIVGKISDNLPKPIKFDPDVDTDQSLEEFEFKIDDGSWKNLLSAIAEKFNCVVEESASEFLVTQSE